MHVGEILFTLPPSNNRDNFPDRVPVDYATYAKAKDKVDPTSLTYSNEEKVGSLKNHIHQEQDPPSSLVDIDEPEGCIFEADGGLPLLILVTKLQSKKLQVGLHHLSSPSWHPRPLSYQSLLQDDVVRAGSEFSQTYPFETRRNLHDKFQHPEDSPFKSGQAHLCVWWALGQQVSAVNYQGFLLSL